MTTPNQPTPTTAAPGAQVPPNAPHAAPHVQAATPTTATPAAPTQQQTRRPWVLPAAIAGSLALGSLVTCYSMNQGGRSAVPIGQTCVYTQDSVPFGGRIYGFAPVQAVEATPSMLNPQKVDIRNAEGSYTILFPNATSGREGDSIVTKLYERTPGTTNKTGACIPTPGAKSVITSQDYANFRVDDKFHATVIMRNPNEKIGDGIVSSVVHIYSQEK